ncbi:hypothetical protein Tco_0397904, partial [Tanacetum coccineum]
NATGGTSIASIHARVLTLAACVLLVPYDMPSGGMNGYISLCVGDPCPTIFRSPVDGMKDGYHG